MGLLGWWPLDGSLDDYSNKSTKMTGDWVVDNNGKIGRCYKKNKSMNIPITPKMLGNNCSLAFWLYVDESVNESTDLFSTGDCNNSTKPRSVLTCFQYPTKNDFHWSFTDDKKNSYQIVGIDSNVLKDNSWTHIALIYDNGTVSRYYNGIFSGKREYTVKAFIDSDAQYLMKGNSGTKINDVRFYNHALSKKEIKEIYKSKILHYKFNSEYEEPTTNLTTSYSRGASVILEDHTNFIRTVYNPGVEFVNRSHNYGCFIMTQTKVAGKTFTVSAEVRVPKLMEIGIILQKNGGNWQTTHTPCKVLTPGKWHKVSVTGTFDTIDDVRIHSRIYPTIKNQFDIEGSYFDVRNPILEEKKHYTPFIKNQRCGVVFDSSGYKNHGYINENSCPEYIEKSVIGSGAFKFNGRTTFLSTRDKFAGKVRDTITFSAWAYKDNWQDGKDERIVSCTEEGGWGFEKDILGTKNYLRVTINLNKTYYLAGSTLVGLKSGWHLFTGTYNGKEVKFYIDGILKSSVAIKNDPSIYYNENNAIFVGAEATGSPITPVNNMSFFDGMIADVRVYATALTDKDILELYENKASLSNDGKLYINELIETGNNISKEITINACGYPSISYVIIDGKRYDGGRSWCILDIDENMNFVSNSIFDVFATNRADQIQAFILKFNSIQENHFIVIYTMDHPSQNNAKIIQLLSNYSNTIKDYVFNGRCAYFLVFRKKDNEIIDERFVPYIDVGKSNTGPIKVILSHNKVSLNKKSQLISDEIDEVSILGMPIKYENGATWARIYHHNSKNGTVTFTNSDWLKTNQEDKKSFLYALEEFRDYNGDFELMLQTSDTKLYNRWRQKNNFTKVGERSGYSPIHIDVPGKDTNEFGGLQFVNTPSTFIHGSLNGDWWFAIAPKAAHAGGSPTFPIGQTSKAVTELWIRIDNIKRKLKIGKDNTISAKEFIEI